MNDRRSPKKPPTLNRVGVTPGRTGASAGMGPFPSGSPWAGQISRSHPVFSNHIAYEQSLLPGLAYIDIVYQWCAAKELDPYTVEIRNLSIYRPMTLDQASTLELVPSAELSRNGAWQLTIEAEVTGPAPGTSPSLVKFATVEVWPSTDMPAFEETVPLTELRGVATSKLDFENAYARWRKLGLQHSGVMKSSGWIHSLENEVWIEIIPPLSEPSYIVNPVIVDASIVGAVDLIEAAADGEQRLFLPLHFGSFRASTPLVGECHARIRRSELERKGELIVLNIDYFDSSGQKVAELKQFNNKLVRTKSLISNTPPNPVKPKAQAALPPQPTLPAGADPNSTVSTTVKSIVSSRIGVPPGSIDMDAGYYDLGLTSEMMLDVVRLVGEAMDLDLSPTLLFEYTTIRQLIEHLSPAASPPPSGHATPAPSPQASQPAPISSHAREVPPGTRDNRIAVIGLAGRYPGSNTIDEFWDNLVNGRDLIREVPFERWDMQAVQRFKSPSGKPMSRWGGFIDDVACFDPQFFQISPKEAESMDPQERLFLQVSWEAMEDAGYTPENIVRPTGKASRRQAGVFVGVMHKDYAILGSEALHDGKDVALSLNYAPIANRVSYTCNFHGPSLAVDTVCSASLTAVHLAMESLRGGECSVAIAGGVNLSLHPDKYITYGMLDMHASDGRCRAFGAGGDGYVSAEGVGAVILKPLAQAIADGDHIYGVLLASSVNHVGKASGMTVPSPVAQGAMISDCLDKAGVDPATVTYIEAHGTGTSLGDPIEVQGLKRAFSGITAPEHACALGSVKSNIGHAESAAGISGLTKVLLQMRHRTLVPTLHSSNINPLVELDGSPFFLPQGAMPWTPPGGGVRRAGVSSFGATGSNAHVILEEHTPAPSVLPLSKSPVLVPLSARTREQLEQYASRLASFLQDQQSGPRDLSMGIESLAYTLQVGRVAMGARLVLLSSSINETIDLLRRFAERAKNSANIWWNEDLDQNNELIGLFSRDAELRDTISRWIASHKYPEVASLWVKGAHVDWNQMYPHGHPVRVSLPTYPFSRKRYWLPETTKDPASPPPARIHPLIHENTSDLNGQTFRSSFTGEEPVMRTDDTGRLQLVAPALLGMALEAIKRSCPDESPEFGIRLTSLEWGQWANTPANEGPIDVSVFDSSSHHGVSRAGFEISQTGEPSASTSLLKGFGEFGNAPPLATGYTGVHERFRQGHAEPVLIDELQPLLVSFIQSAHPTIKGVIKHAGETLVELNIPSAARRGPGQDVQNVLFVEGLIKIALAVTRPINSRFQPADGRSFTSLDAVNFHGDCVGRAYAWVRPSQPERTTTACDVDVFDPTGNILLSLRGLEGPGRRDSADTSSAIPELPLYFEEGWEKVRLTESAAPAPFNVGVCFLSPGEASRQLKRSIDNAVPGAELVFVAQGQQYERVSRSQYVIRPRDATDLARLFQAVRADFGEIDTTLYLSPLERDTTAEDAIAIAAIIKTVAPIPGPRMKMVVAGRNSSPLPGAHFDALTGFQRSIQLALPQLNMLAIRFDAPPSGGFDSDEAINTLVTEMLHTRSGSVRYLGSTRLVPDIKQSTHFPGSDQAGAPIRHRGTYLVTGGLGGIGLLVARHLCQAFQAKCVLVSRSLPSAEQWRTLREMESLGGQVLHIQADVTSQEDMESAMVEAETQFGPIHGVFHAAGTVGTGTILHRGLDEFQNVLDAKVEGTLVLESLLQERPVDFVCLFSSSAAIVGDFGSCDYAVANRFQVSFGQQARTRDGHPWTVLAWPLWRDGGMGLGAEATEQYLQSSGQKLLETDDAMRSMETAISAGSPPTLVQVGNEAQIASYLSRKSSVIPEHASNSPSKPSTQGQRSPTLDPSKWMLGHLQEIAHELLHVPLNEVSGQTMLSDLGFDSITLTQYAKAIGDQFGIKIAPSEFYTHSTLIEVAQHIVSVHPARFAVLEPAGSETLSPSLAQDVPPPVSNPSNAPRPSRPRSRSRRGHVSSRSAFEPIAIIGMAGRFPGAADINSLWEVLENGQCTISEIPINRFDWRQCFDPTGREGTSIGKWLGSMDDYEGFDAGFFEISPREASAMDPRQRILLQESWHAIEDAALTEEVLDRGQIGVFVGAERGDYAPLDGERMLTSDHDGILAARLSYFLNLKAPVLTVNTACSSGLVALHQACLSLRNGECETAIAAGVNLLLSPSSFVAMSAAGMLSNDGHCYAFDKKAKGLVPGEAVAVVVVKRLSDALADGDPIRSVIVGHGVNYDGRTNGITAPNGQAQQRLFSDIYGKFGLDPSGIGHVVAHGTGTRLGDPVEISALQAAFREHSNDTAFCALTSTKPNIGHTFAPSGLVSLISLSQGLSRELIPPTLNCSEPSDYLDWANSPFFVNTALRAWPRSGSTRRLGAVSAFGMSGTNAHVVLGDAADAQQFLN